MRVIKSIETNEEFIYPTETNNSGEDGSEIILKSADVSAYNQDPIFKTYLSATTNNSAKWQYYFSDIDDAVYNNLLYYSINTTEHSISLDDQSTKNDYSANDLIFDVNNNLEISNLINGNVVNTYYYSNKIETETPISETSKTSLIHSFFFFLQK